MFEQRRDKRIPIHLPTKIYLGHLTHTGETQNVSKHGVCLICSSRFPQGAILDLELLIQQADALHISGRVIWIREVFSRVFTGFTYGVELRTKPQEYEAYLEQLMGAIHPNGMSHQ